MSKVEAKVISLRQKRDQKMLGSLFTENEEAVRRFLAMRRVPESEADDFLQEVFIRLAKIEGLSDKILPEPKAQRAFLYTIANNLLVDSYRKKARQKRYVASAEGLLQADFELAENGPESLLSNREDIARVKAVIKAMRPNCRQAFVLNRYRYYSYTQIAEVMGVSAKQVEKYLSEALTNLRNSLPEYLQGKK